MRVKPRRPPKSFSPPATVYFDLFEAAGGGCIARVDGLKLTDVPDAKLLLMCAAALAAAVAAVALWRTRRGGGPMMVQPRQAPPLKGSHDAESSRRVSVELGREILELLEGGRRAEAVALVRGATGWGVAEADEAVVRLEKLMKRLGT